MVGAFIAAIAATLTLNAVLLIRLTRLQRRHREAKHTLNRVAGERDLLKWEKEMGRG